jgi:hypothetical protein
MAEDSKIEQHNKKLKKLKKSVHAATERVKKHTQALANPSLSAAGVGHHTKGLKAATTSLTKHRASFRSATELGIDLANSGSGKVVVDMPE